MKMVGWRNLLQMKRDLLMKGSFLKVKELQLKIFSMTADLLVFFTQSSI